MLSIWGFLVQPFTSAALLATAAAAWPLGRRLARRRGCSRAVAALFVLSLGVILALTMTPNGAGRYSLLPPHYLTQITDPGWVWATLRARPGDNEEYANIALYVPLGFLGRYVWRGVTAATLCGSALTVVVETCQYGIVGRAGTLTDIRNNALGTVIGALAAAAVIRTTRRRYSPALTSENVIGHPQNGQ